MKPPRRIIRTVAVLSMALVVGFAAMAIRHRTLHPKDVWQIIRGQAYSVTGSICGSRFATFFAPHGDSSVVYTLGLDIRNELSIPLRIDSIAVYDSVSRVSYPFEFHGILGDESLPRKGEWGGNAIAARTTSHVELSTQRSQAEIRAGDHLAWVTDDNGLLAVRIYTDCGSLTHTIHVYAYVFDGETKATRLEKELMER
jgi:hypothetical protein